MLAVVPPPVTVRVPSKINLHLSVGDVREDGFHELVTVFQALSLSDEVTVAATGLVPARCRCERPTQVPTPPESCS